MSNLLTYLVVHCTSTPPTMKVSKGDIESWHKGPLDNKDGTVTYLGKKYTDRSFLPNDFINGRAIHKLKGRGWDRLGYSDIIHRNGLLENITPYDNDNFIDNSEKTWGATGVNSIARHIVLVGGWRGHEHNGTFPFTDIFTSSQFITLNKYIKHTITFHPDIKIIGHRDVPHSNKTCPNFDIVEFCKVIGIPNINTGL